MAKGIIEAKEFYPQFGSKAKNRAEAMIKRLWPVMQKFGARDIGKAEGLIYGDALLREAGEHKAADKLEHLIHWMLDHKPEKAALIITDGMAGKGGK